MHNRDLHVHLQTMFLSITSSRHLTFFQLWVVDRPLIYQQCQRDPRALNNSLFKSYSISKRTAENT